MNSSPVFVQESESWALLFKPHGMPSAPLLENEPGTLLSWFLDQRPQAKIVSGKKKIEYGLIHRLDTATSGLVLCAKTQNSYNFFQNAQHNNLIEKIYHAISDQMTDAYDIPWTEVSRFRAWGPGRKEVRPLYPEMRGWEAANKDYQTDILSVKDTILAEMKDSSFIGKNQKVLVKCRILQGFRHQIRVHLAYRGYPIVGDRMYHPKWKFIPESETVPLQLHATGISFPDPDSGLQVFFSLPPPDKMNQ